MNNFAFISEFVKRLLTSIMLLFCVGGAYLHSVELFTMMLTAIFIIIVFFELPKLFEFSWIPFLMMSLLYPGVSIFSLVYLNYKFHSINIILPLYPFLVAWVADTFGYMVGKPLGFHKICPLISPGKSWEGLLGSMFGVFVLNIFILPRIGIVWLPSLKIMGVMLISIIFTLGAFAGGLFMSFLKRRKGVKDAGNVLPGHGGFLDRFDSVFVCVLLTCFFILIS